MSLLEIDASDFGRAAAGLKGAYRKAAAAPIRAAVRASANLARQAIRAEMKPHRRTGKMASKVKVTLKGYGADTEAQIKAGGPVAHLLIGGTAAHDITPRRRGFLVITGGTRGRTILGYTSAAVSVAGVQADPMVDRAERKVAPAVSEQFAAARDAIIANLANRMTKG